MLRLTGEAIADGSFFWYNRKYGNYSEPHSQSRAYALCLLMWLLRHIHKIQPNTITSSHLFIIPW